MTASAEFVDQAASLIRRSRAGDQNALATIYRIGEESRKGSKNRRIAAMAEAIKAYMETHPATDYQLGAEGPALIAETTSKPSSSKALATVPKAAPVAVMSPAARAKAMEMRKPVLPRGIFNQLFDPESFGLTIVRACQYRNGLAAAAVVLASGPPLTGHAIRELGYSQFGSDEAASIFFYGVKFHGENAWEEVAPHLDPPLRRCLAIGQCVGRARRLQAVRVPRSQISAYSPVAGWELGE